MLEVACFFIARFKSSPSIKKLLKVNQICEARFNAGEDIKEIAKDYAAEKAKIKQEERMLENKLKTIHKMLKEKKRKGA